MTYYTDYSKIISTYTTISEDGPKCFNTDQLQEFCTITVSVHQREKGWKWKTRYYSYANVFLCSPRNFRTSGFSKILDTIRFAPYDVT